MDDNMIVNLENPNEPTKKKKPKNKQNHLLEITVSLARVQNSRPVI